MTSQLKKQVFLSAATAISASGAHLVDYRFENADQRVLYGVLTSGAEINLYFNYYHPDRPDLLLVHHLEATISAGSSSYTTATNSFAEIINGPCDQIEVVKAGASGTATVFGII